MRYLTRWLKLLGAACVLSVLATSAYAQASRTWVSGVGDDANPCSRTAPCKTFAGAISKTAMNGEINCLDPGGFGAVTITKSITIDCHEIFASILNAGTNGVNIAFDAFNAGTDVRKTVRLRNINFNGVSTGVVGIRITGGATIAGGAVFIEDCLLDGNFAGAARGISDERIAGGELSISHTTVRNMGGTGIAVAPASGATLIRAVLDNVRVQNANFGVAAGHGVVVDITNSVFSGNTAAGIEEDSGASVSVDNSVTTNNGTGVQTVGTIRLSNTEISFNATGIAGAGSTLTFGTNRIFGNVAAGNAPSAIGGASSALGQQ
jgi:hypothetical protein